MIQTLISSVRFMTPNPDSMLGFSPVVTQRKEPESLLPFPVPAGFSLGGSHHHINFVLLVKSDETAAQGCTAVSTNRGRTSLRD